MGFIYMIGFICSIVFPCFYCCAVILPARLKRAANFSILNRALLYIKRVDQLIKAFEFCVYLRIHHTDIQAIKHYTTDLQK